MQTLQDSLQTVQVPTVKTTDLEISFFELLTRGGWVGNTILVILLILFIIAIYLFFERIFTINKLTQSDDDFIHHIRDFVHDSKIEAAINLCKRTNTPEARMIEKGLERIGRPIKEINDAIENTGKLELYRLEKNVNILATISGAAPMIGFLGTVIGMIIAFAQIANTEGQVDPKSLSSGIYVAMLTTAAGLIVGIVAYLAYNYLVMKIDKTVHNIESSVIDFLDLLNKPVVK